MYVKHVELVCGADPFLPPYILHCLCAIVQKQPTAVWLLSGTIWSGSFNGVFFSAKRTRFLKCYDPSQHKWVKSQS